MKQSNKSSLITGVVLLAIAALFSISLILQPLDFGVAGPGHNNIFYQLGKMLYTVYGFSSILIPAFLFLAGLSCFATKWTARKTMRLLTAIIPFFTAVITENIIRSIVDLGKSSFMGVKIAVAVVTGLMLIVIEFLGTGILADKLNTKFYQKTGKKAPESDDELDLENIEPEEGDLSNDDYKKIKSTSIFDDALKNVKSIISPKAKEEVKDSEIAENTDEEISLDDISEEAVPAFNEVSAEEIESYGDEISTSENDVTEVTEEVINSNPATIITQDEYAALLDEPTEEPVVDELEWNNVPPAPAELPAEYKEEVFDENDPALEFPPKEDIVEEVNAQDNIEDSFEEASTEDYDTPEENDNQEYDLTYNEENPYSAARYIDTVVENPKFPHGIRIADDSEEEEIIEEKKTKEPERPKFPTKISLDNDLDSEIAEFEDTLNQDDISKPVITAKDFEDFEASLPDSDAVENDEEDFEEQENIEPEISFEPESTEIPEPEFETEIVEEEPIIEEVKHSFYDKITEPKTEKGFASSVSSVFSDMEADIRKENPIPEIEDSEEIEEDFNDEIDLENDEEDSNVSFDGSMNDSTNDDRSLELTATNLTKDELTDFFNAQQEENRPKTNEIMANPPKVGNRATKKGPYVIPSDLLIAYKDDQYWLIDDATKQASLDLKQTLAEFGIEAEITGIKKGPVVTMFEILPAPGVRLQKIAALQDNIALSLAAQSVRIVAPIPGKQAVGIEVPNRHRSVVGFREIIEMDLPDWKKMSVPVILGKDILGKAQLVDLAKTPHMLIAGATGSGKSVCVNSLILSILYKRSYKDVKLIMVDPKVVELKLYNDIPHLLTPVITEPKKALQALQYCLCEMERRYALLDGMGVRDISNYNQKIKEQHIVAEKLPYIVVIIDEFADLMATSGKELESIVARLTAMSRAVGIHLVLATQRPSVNVITGLIKANIPTRIAFMVSSRTDSNIIIDSTGAEKLLGRGDMLYASATDPAPIRIQGTFISDQEVEDVVKAVKEFGEPDYIDDEIFVEEEDERARDLFGEPIDDEDPLYDEALNIVVQAGKASASYLQRRLSIGYNRAARLVEEMEERGIVGPANGSKPREIIHMP